MYALNSRGFAQLCVQLGPGLAAGRRLLPAVPALLAPPELLRGGLLLRLQILPVLLKRCDKRHLQLRRLRRRRLRGLGSLGLRKISSRLRAVFFGGLRRLLRRAAVCVGLERVRRSLCAVLRYRPLGRTGAPAAMALRLHYLVAQIHSRPCSRTPW